MAISNPKKRRTLMIVASILGVLVLLVLALPFLIDVDHFRPQVETQLKHSLGRDVNIGRLSLSILGGGVSAQKVIIGDDPDFSKDPFIVAKSLNIGVEWWPLISSRAMHITSLTLQDPQVHLLRSPSGKWNFSSLGSTAQPKATVSASPSRTPDVSVQKLNIANGTITVGRAHSSGKQYIYSNVDLTAKNIAFGSTIPFTLSAKTPPSGALKVEGTAGPLNQSDMAATPLTAHVTIKNLDLASTGFVDPSSGIAGLLDYDGDIKSNGQVVHTEGKTRIANLKLVKAGAPARQPVTLDYATDYDVAPQSGVLKKGDIHVGNSTVHLTGDYETRSDTVVRMKMQGSNLPIQDIEGLLPAFGVVLPAGSSLQGGTATANLSINGPVSRLVTTGPIDISNARLKGFDLGSKLAPVAKLAGVKTGGDTLIQTLSSQLQVAPEGIKADNLNLIVANLGTLTGGGTIGANNQLNFKMLAKFAHSGNTIAGIANRLGLGSAEEGIPFLVQGTSSAPVFVPDLGAALARGKMGSPLANPNDPNAQQQKGLGGLLNGILGKKKSQ
jgi:AsmA protein